VAAVDKIEEMRKPEDFIGYRNRYAFARSIFQGALATGKRLILDSLRSATPLGLSSLGTFLFSDKKVPPPAGTGKNSYMKVTERYRRSVTTTSKTNRPGGRSLQWVRRRE